MTILGPDGKPVVKVEVPAPALDAPEAKHQPTVADEMAGMSKKDRRAYLRHVAEFNVNNKFPKLSRTARRAMAHRLAKDSYFKKAVLSATAG